MIKDQGGWDGQGMQNVLEEEGCIRGFGEKIWRKETACKTSV